MLKDIERVMFQEKEIEKRVLELAERISQDYAGKELLLVGVLKGSVVFTADLLKRIQIPCEIDFIAVSTYGNSTETSGVVKILKDLDFFK